jgi:hypothetical protein
MATRQGNEIGPIATAEIEGATGRHEVDMTEEQGAHVALGAQA